MPFAERLRRLAAPILRGARFRREEEIARGGMGVVHRVKDTELDRMLALKEMILGPANEHALAAARFLEEAQVTAQLDHPGIVPIHEVGLNAEGHLYFAMKLVRGRDLRAILQLARNGSEGWVLPRMLGVLLKVCEAMAYAHSKGVIHRDLKPGNVMVGHFGEVYVMDWGLARTMGRQDVHDIRLKPAHATASLRTERREEREETPDSPLVTMDGVVVGTPAYMAPEQARGEIQLLSPRCDVYSIGAMLYHLLTGQTPYFPPGARLSQHTVLARVLGGPPDSVHELASDVPVELVAICEKAMERDPARRYQGMLDLADDLRAFLEGRVVHAHETGAWAELRKWVVRNKPLAASLALGLLTLLAGLGASLFLMARSYRLSELAAKNQLRALDGEALAQREKARADAVADAAQKRADEVMRLSALQDLEDLIAKSDQLWPVRSEVTALEEWLADASKLLEELPEHERRLTELEEHGASEDRWWRNQLGKLVNGLQALGDPAHGLIAGLSAEFGWGIERRLEFARRLHENSLEGSEAARRWAEALASIRSRTECPQYHGLELEPQLGLMPIGLDPASGLWEFAHLQSGEPAQRDEHGKLVIVKGMGVVLVLIPGGSFWMGSQSTAPAGRNYSPLARPAESPVHEVTLEAFFISKYELTQDQWSRFAGSNPSAFTDGTGTGMPLNWPVEQVSWTECDLMTRRMGLTLPTEAQWEYAARATTTSDWWTGDERESLYGAANLADLALKRVHTIRGLPYEEWLDDGAASTCTVGSYAGNPFGLHDVHGSVSEWCRESRGSYSSVHRAGDGELLHVSGPPAYSSAVPPRIYRGGAFLYDAEFARCAQRSDAGANYRAQEIGLRPARPIVRD